jgi:AraC-like DNA-binding protein/quercetin dioxygenase-like cupin family protein
MSRARHDRQDVFSESLFADTRLPVRGLSVTLPDRHRLARHSHPWAQLVYAERGSMHVSTPAATWLVPPTRAIWVPAGTVHELTMRGAVAMRTLYLAPDLASSLSSTCHALQVCALLRELVLHIVGVGALAAGTAAHQHLAQVLVGLLDAGTAGPPALPLPQDPRARRLARHIAANPGAASDLPALTAGAGASLRTLQRLFAAETGLALEAWRTRARMQHAMARLSAGGSVTQAALDAGYRSLSAFIGAFRREFGMTPGEVRAHRER